MFIKGLGREMARLDRLRCHYPALRPWSIDIKRRKQLESEFRGSCERSVQAAAL